MEGKTGHLPTRQVKVATAFYIFMISSMKVVLRFCKVADRLRPTRWMISLWLVKDGAGLKASVRRHGLCRGDWNLQRLGQAVRGAAAIGRAIQGRSLAELI
jgi:hypothetical protein